MTKRAEDRAAVREILPVDRKELLRIVSPYASTNGNKRRLRNGVRRALEAYAEEDDLSPVVPLWKDSSYASTMHLLRNFFNWEKRWIFGAKLSKDGSRIRYRYNAPRRSGARHNYNRQLFVSRLLFNFRQYTSHPISYGHGADKNQTAGSTPCQSFLSDIFAFANLDYSARDSIQEHIRSYDQKHQ